MTCNIAPLGDCTLEADDIPIGKVYDESLGTIEPLLITSDGSTFTMTWTIDTSLTNQIVVIAGREQYDSTSLFARIWAVHTDGTITTGALVAEATYKYWMRRENAVAFGPWFLGKAINDSSWTSNSVEVTHYGVQLYHDSEPLLYG